MALGIPHTFYTLYTDPIFLFKNWRSMINTFAEFFKTAPKRLVDDYANMDDFLDDLIPRIHHWSEDLAEREYYTGDYPWREVRDDDFFEESVLYFFKDENEFLFSINGNVQNGQWRALESNKILIEKNAMQHSDSELYNMLFMNDEFMILDKPGDQRSLGKSKYLVLVREHKMRHLDWRSIMSKLSEDHKKGFGTIIFGIMAIAVLLTLYFFWRSRI